MSRIKWLPALAMLAALGATPMARANGAGAAATPVKPGAAASLTKVHAEAAVPRTDLNHASREELMKLPGVDEATADKIVAARPLKSKRELETKKLVSTEEYRAIASRVFVRPEPAEGKVHK